MKTKILLIFLLLIAVTGFGQNNGMSISSPTIDTGIGIYGQSQCYQVLRASNKSIKYNQNMGINIIGDTMNVIRHLVDDDLDKEIQLEHCQYELYQTRVKYAELLRDYSGLLKLSISGLNEIKNIISPKKKTNEKSYHLGDSILPY